MHLLRELARCLGLAPRVSALDRCRRLPCGGLRRLARKSRAYRRPPVGENAMIGAVLTAAMGRVGRSLARAAILAAGIAGLVWLALRRGRRDAQAEEAIRRANTRINALKTARDIHHDLQDADRDDLQRRADRWMRD